MRAFITNFAGLGNGIVAVPLLRLLERRQPGVTYFHSENGVLADPQFARAAGLRGLQGFTPEIWRRFARPDWEDILAFCDREQIDTVMSLRNEGPYFDLDFYAFQRRYGHRFRFVLPELSAGGFPVPLVESLRAMIEPGDSATDLDHVWLSGLPSVSTGPSVEVAFFTGASVRQKRWAADSWIALGMALESTGTDVISIYSGATLEEAQDARRIVEGLRQRAERVEVRQAPPGTLWRLFEDLRKAAVVVTNDTVAVHLAAAAGGRVVGLYLCTDPAIWAPVSPRTAVCEAPARRRCERLKPHAGNCGYYGSATVKDCGASLSSDDVLRTVDAQLRLAITERNP